MNNDGKVTVYRKAHFNAAHRLYRPDWSEEQNDAVFGKCNNPYYHGHNYELVVAVRGRVDAQTGYVMDMKVLKDFIAREVEEPFDHKNLNEQVPPFHEVIPSAENIAIVIWERLRPHIDPEHDLKVRLYETPRNFVDYEG